MSDPTARRGTAAAPAVRGASPYADRLARIPVTAHEDVIDGVATRWWEYGEADADSTLLVVHGFRGDHHGLEPVVAFLPGMRVIMPDLPGFGASARFADRRHSVASYARWLGAFSARVVPGVEHVLLGHSFGSIVCAHALADPSLAPSLAPRALVLVNPIAANALEGPRAIATGIAVGYYRLGAALPERAGAALLGSSAVIRVMTATMTKTRDKRLRAFVLDQHRRYFSAFADRAQVLEAFRASVGNDVGEVAAGIRLPTLLIAGERDDITSLGDQERLAATMPDARLEVIPGVGHLVHYETPAAAAALVERFLDELTETGVLGRGSGAADDAGPDSGEGS